MTHIELQKILGDTIKSITDSKNNAERTKAYQDAEHIAKIAKQMINNADVVLRTDKLCGSTARINNLIGDNNAT